MSRSHGLQHGVEDWREALRSHADELAREHGVESLGLFGSHVRGEASPGSDLDVLVTFSRPVSLLDFVALEERLSELLGVRVDLVMRDALKPHIGERILKEVMPV